MSPLLWCIVVNSLLIKLNALGYTAQAYADNQAIVIRSKYLNTVADLMPESLRVVDSWCKTKGLSVNPEKTEVVLFTRKRKTLQKNFGTFKPNFIRIYEKTLKSIMWKYLQNSAKYLIAH